MREKQEIIIKDEYIELFKLLKFSGLVNEGSEAKFRIENGEVMVNNEIETRKRKKIFSGDIVFFENNSLVIKSQKSE